MWFRLQVFKLQSQADAAAGGLKAAKQGSRKAAKILEASSHATKATCITSVPCHIARR